MVIGQRFVARRRVGIAHHPTWAVNDHRKMVGGAHPTRSRLPVPCSLFSLPSSRPANTLVEVLIALVVLGIGLTGVIALFPVGVNRVRNAVLDTRTTLMSKTALDTFQLKRMHNDQALVNWNGYDQAYLTALIGGSDPAAAARPILDAYVSPLNTFGNVYAWMPYTPGLWGSVQPNDVANADWPFYLSAEADRVPFDVTQFNNDTTTEFNGVVQNASSDFNWSYPVLLDPWLFDHMAYNLQLFSGSTFPGGVPRINISTALAGIPTPTYLPGYYSDVTKWPSGLPAAPYCDVAVVTTFEVLATLPGTSAPLSPLAKLERDLLKSRWFASLSDITFLDQESLGQTKNPSSQEYLAGYADRPQTIHYFEPTPADPATSLTANAVPLATAERSYEYTWAAMIQRRLVSDVRDDVVNPTTGAITNPMTPEVARPNPESRDLSGRLAIMCFYRRNLENPYTVIEGCFYNGSRKVTLSWPAGGVATPEIGFGTWLCEMSVSRDIASGACNRHTGVYPRLDGDPNNGFATYVKRHYRRSFAFYKVIEVVGEPEVIVDVNGLARYYMEVMVDRTAKGYPLRYARMNAANTAQLFDGADARPIDPYFVPQWPIVDPKIGSTSPTPSPYAQQYDDETNVTQNRVQYYPVVIFDGLREVFEYEF